MSGSLIPITQHLDDMNINRRKSAADSLNKSSLSVDISKLNDSRLERKRRKLSLNIKEFNRPGFTSNCNQYTLYIYIYIYSIIITNFNSFLSELFQKKQSPAQPNYRPKFDDIFSSYDEKNI